MVVGARATDQPRAIGETLDAYHPRHSKRTHASTRLRSTTHHEDGTTDMTHTRTPFIGGNWKMNTDLDGAKALAGDIAAGITSTTPEVAIYPPFPYLLAAAESMANKGAVRLGAQDLWRDTNGAFTGEVSAEMLSDCCVTTALVGHSERRHVLGEADELVNQKLQRGLNAGLRMVLCIGETLDQRDAGETDAVNERQLRAGLKGVHADAMADVVIAYEPVWAIGTGKTATPEDAQDAHAKARAVLASICGDAAAQATRIIYGGSMKPGNATDLMAMDDIDGGLIGGASLKADDFLAIIKAAG